MTDSSNLAPQEIILVSLNRSVTAAKLLSGVVHEVNNALQVISGTVELLGSRPDVPPAMLTSLDRLGRQTARAAAVLAEVQQFTRASLAETGRVNLREVAEHSLSLRAFAIRRASLTSRLAAPDTESFYATGNRARIQQALLQLIMNAEQALAGSSGEVLVEIGGDAGTVSVTVTDKGAGVTIDPLDRAFDAFVSSRDPWEGAGLGLWAARAIAAEHGGTVTATSTPGGSSFVLRLPRVTT